MIAKTTNEDLAALPLDELVLRMDGILRESIIERYGQLCETFPISLVSQITITQKAQSLSAENKRHLAYITFSYLVQLELGSVTSRMSNLLLFNNRYDENTSWQSPTFRLCDGAIHQYQIVSSRIAMEVFMDLLHFLETGKRIEKKRSKLKAFRNWLCTPQNQFHYFAHVLLSAYRFDRGIRTPEVHGVSRFPSRLLLLQRPTHDELNECHNLTNTLMSCWKPLLEILEGKKPNFMNIREEDQAWFTTYMNGTEEEVVNQLALMFSGLNE